MYESFYKLHAKPFRLSPDPNYFYPSSGHKRALSYLLYGLNQGEGFVVITGAPGTGKTTLAHKLLSQIDTSGILVAHLSSTQVEAEDLLRLVATSFKLRSENVSKAALIKDIESFLIARARERKRCLLVVDEAQNLPERSIEELRMLSNFQINHHALLQIFLLGQEQFRTMLESPELEQLHQRVIANFHLNPLDVIETQRYVESRLRQSGWANDPHIADDAYGVIYSYTGGLPRRINMFCDRLFLYGYMEGLHVFTRESVVSVIEELKTDVSTRGRNVVFAQVDRPAPPVEAISPAPVEPAAASQSVAPPRATPSKPVSEPPAPPSSPIAPAAAPASGTIAPAPEPGRSDAFAGSIVARASAVEAAGKSAPLAARALDAALPQPEPESLPRYLRADRSPVESAPSAPTETPVTVNTRPSAPAEHRARWTAALGAVAVLLIIGYWFFPYLQDIEPEPRVRLPVPPAEPAPAAETSDSRPVIEDPTERILTEREFAPVPDTTGAQDVTASRAAEAATPAAVPETATVAPTPAETEPRKTVPAKVLPQSPPVARAEPQAAASPRPKQTPQKAAATQPRAAPVREQPAAPAQTGVSQRLAPAEQTAPIVAPVVAPAVATPPAAVSPASAAKDAAPAAPSPVAASPAAEPVAAPAPVAPTPVPELEPLAQVDLAQLLLKFTRYYEEGNLDLFARLFANDIRTEDRNGITALRDDYRELFQKTASRQIILGDIRWDRSGATAEGSGPFEVRIRPRAQEPLRVFKGTIRFQVEKRESELLITSLLHTAR